MTSIQLKVEAIRKANKLSFEMGTKKALAYAVDVSKQIKGEYWKTIVIQLELIDAYSWTKDKA